MTKLPYAMFYTTLHVQSDPVSAVNVVTGCRPAGLMDCTHEVLVGQCGGEITRVIREMDLENMATMGCATRKRQ